MIKGLHSMLSFVLALFLLFFVSCTNDKEDLLALVDCGDADLVLNLIETVSSGCGNTGTLKVEAMGGTVPYTYILGQVSQNQGLFESLFSGDYTISVVDGNGCSATVQGLIDAEENDLSLSILTTASGCETALSTITITASGGAAPYLYSLNGGALVTSNTFERQGIGPFDVKVTDRDGCEATASGTVLSGVSLSRDVMPIIRAECSTSSSCHGTGSSGARPTLINANQVLNRASRIGIRIANNTMPPGGGMSESQKNTIACWVSDGAPDN